MSSDDRLLEDEDEDEGQGIFNPWVRDAQFLGLLESSQDIAQRKVILTKIPRYIKRKSIKEPLNTSQVENCVIDISWMRWTSYVSLDYSMYFARPITNRDYFFYLKINDM